MKTTALIPVLLMCTTVLAAQNHQNIDKTATAARISSQSIHLDGQLNDTGWQQAPAYNGFTQRDPKDGAEATYPTSFRIVYDTEYLYVGINAIDGNLDKIKAILTRRDEYTESDWVYVSLDSYNDNRTAFEFGLNAAGVQHDLRRYDDNNADFDWDAVWEGAVHIHNSGWSAEFQIPFRELRFNTGDNMEWGLQVYREFPRNNNELDVWNYWSKDETGFVSQYGRLTGLSDIESIRPLYIAPYVVGQSNFSENLVTSSHPETYDLTSNLGADVRYTFSNGLTMNATINPDFGQVEADPADFNLTEYETYFPEKRPFFKEGSNILNFNVGIGDGNAQNNSLYYSRRIGARPSRILTAGKLTGKTKQGLSIGVMNATTADGFTALSSNPNTGGSEPLTNYFLSRVQKDYRDGQTTIGGLITSVNRQLDQTNESYLHSAAYTGGLDFSHEFLDREYSVEGKFAFSNVQGTDEAITRTQTSSARYFQRPDAKYISVDTTKTSLTGFANNFAVAKNEGHWRAAVGILNYGPGFEVNDLGFLQRVDDVTQFIWVGYREWEQNSYFQEYSINFNEWTAWNYAPTLLNKGGNINAHATLLNNWETGTGVNYNYGGLNTTALRGGPAIASPSNWNTWGYLETDNRKDVSYELFGMYFENADDIYQYELSLNIKLRPRQNFQFSMEPGFRELSDTWAWICKAYDHEGNTHYIFSGLEQKTFSLTLRADYTMTPNLSIQYYAQPYFTAGKYANYIETDQRLARDFGKRFTSLENFEVNYNNSTGEYAYEVTGDNTPDYFGTSSPRNDFNYKQYRSNMVIRWEYFSGSTLYLVWSQGYTDVTQMGNIQLTRDVRSLFDAPSDNVLLLKLSYLLNV